MALPSARASRGGRRRRPEPSLSSPARKSDAALALHLAVALPLSMLGAAVSAHGSGTPVVAGGGTASELITQQGSGAPTNFGDFVAAGGGLDAPYSYFVEVPAGVSCLGIDIFDPDVGAGANDQANQRDRVRGSFNTAAAYSLRNPAGGAVATSFTTGDVSGPGDNAWMSLYRSSGASLGTFRDTFSVVSYNNSDGTLAWAGPWTETGDTGGAAGGSIFITGGQLRVSQAVRSVTRSANLTAQNACRAVLTFNLSTPLPTTLEGTDCLDVQVSGDGGVSFATLQRYCGNVTSAVSFDISTFIASDTRVRFTAATNITPTAEYFAVDNVQIQAFGAGSAAAGHWEVQVDMSSAVTTGDDVNAFGIRAHDGDPGAGGTELNIYTDSFYTVGINTGTRNYELFPYVTSGCTGDLNNFDWDATGGSTFGAVGLTSRLGALTLAGTTSPNDIWQSDAFSAWTDADEADDYGIWSLDAAIDDTGAANFGVVYLGNESAAAAPPSSQPEPDTFRIYLTTDAGTAPVKPYLAQFLTWVGGPNPPTTGNTSTVQVTVRLTNPAGNVDDITFSTPSNVVTINVPGSGVVYAGGGATVSAGSIVSQPAAGGTGNVVWNPGTVAPGSVAILTYRLQVTPAAAGFLAVTGVSGSGNGTRGRWLDETGNTTQARATFDFGELCTLGVDTALATYTQVSRFDVIPEGRDAMVEWETGSEAGTLGFALFRWSPRAAAWIQVHDDLLVALLDAPQGGVYRFRDPEAFAEGPAPSYALVEVDGGGRQTLVETASRMVDGATRSIDAMETYERTAHGLAAPLPRLPLPASVRPIPAGLEEKVQGRRRAKVTTDSAGLVFVATEDLAVALNESPYAVRVALRRYAFAVSNLGQEVSWLADREGKGLYFYSEALSSPYSENNVYWIERGRGRPMEQFGARAALSPATETFAALRHEEVDSTAVLVLPLAADSDFWFWGGLRSGESLSFPLQAPGTVPDDTAVLTAFLQGATDSGTANEHHLEVRLNGAYLGETSWSGIRSHTASFAFDAALLQETDNVVEITALRDAGAPQSIVFVDGFDIAYQRRLSADGAELTFAPAASAELSGFTDPDLLLFDLSDPRRPIQLVGFEIEQTGSTYGFDFHPNHPGAQHLAISTQAVRQPLRIEGRRDLVLSGSALAVDYILIAHPSLVGGAERLAGLRRDRGLQTLVVATDDVYDAFSHGITDPRAFRSLLLEASHNGRRAPRYVALVGTGTFDYRDLSGKGDNLVPPLLVTTSSGIFASDNRIAELDGDGYPDLVVGRIPVRDAAELEAFVDKLETYESTAGEPWRRRVTLAADRPSQGVRFEDDSERLTAFLPASTDVERVYLAQQSVTEARARMFSLLEEGTAVVHYLGHGGLDRIGAQGLVQLADVPGLANGERTPLVMALTCTVNRFEIPGLGALGEELVRHSTGGAIAVWSASGLSNHFAAAPLGETFLELLLDDPRHVVGDAALRALPAVDDTLASLYVLLGDPTTEIQLDAR